MAAPVPESSTAHAGNPTTSATITLPPTAANDILVLVYCLRDTVSAPTVGGTYAGGAWTEFLGDDGASTPGAGCQWSRATGNHTGETVTVDHASAGSISCAVIRVSGCLSSASPIDTNTNTRRDAASPDVNTLTGFNTTVADTLVMLATGGTDDVAAMSSPTQGGSAMNLTGTALSSRGNQSNVGIADRSQAAIGATGDFDFTQNLGIGDAKWIFGFALKPELLLLSAVFRSGRAWPPDAGILNPSLDARTDFRSRGK